MSNTFLINERLELATIQAEAKQHPEAELLLSETYSHCLSTLSSKNDKEIFWKIWKNCVSFNRIIWLTMLKMRLEMESRSRRYEVDQMSTRTSWGPKLFMHILPHFQHSRPLTIARFLSFITKKCFLYYSDIMSVIYPWFLKRVKKVDSGIKKVTVSQKISWTWIECIVVKSKLFPGSGTVAMRQSNPIHKKGP